MNLFSVLAVFFELINWKLICSVDNLKYDNAECHERDWLCIGTANIYRNFAIVDVVLIAVNLYSMRHVSFDTKSKTGFPAFHFLLSL